MSWALLSVHVAHPSPSRMIGLNVPKGRSRSWGYSLTIGARWPGLEFWLLLCDLGQVTVSHYASVSLSTVGVRIKQAMILDQCLASVSGLTKMGFNSLAQRKILIWLRQSLLPRK